MKQETIYVAGMSVTQYVVDALVVGSGCAGFNAADHLYMLGVTDVALVTEGVNMGTSRNTGSDKQTYYKLSLAGGPDSVQAMAKDLFDGNGIHGDVALAQAANSVRCFMKLVNLGVPFPTDAYGQYVGYQTDHDLGQRATSAGPLTSKYMTQALEQSVREKQIPILNGLTVIQLLVEQGRVRGALCVDWEGALTVICAGCVIMATGGPAHCYEDSVYPPSQTGMSGLALEAGADGANLCEWQYGIASTGFRWNLSGTYQQVLPRYISVDDAGTEREFLLDYFPSPEAALDLVFLKGYQWPFDSSKIPGSSLIDLCVYRERVLLGRKVFLDYRAEPRGLETGFSGLGPDAQEYLRRSDALIATPIARLEKMNPAAIALYKSHGIDLHSQMLEIAVCAQHHNGGIAVDADWQTSVKNLYVIGEAAGTFGVRRPGGSALNAAQVGALRAAEHIACIGKPRTFADDAFQNLVIASVTQVLEQRGQALQISGEPLLSQRKRLQQQMSRCASYLRSPSQMHEFRMELENLYRDFFSKIIIDTPAQTARLYKTKDMVLTQIAVLSAMEFAAAAFGSRGGSVVLEESRKDPVNVFLGLAIAPGILHNEHNWLQTRYTPQGFVNELLPVRPIPQPDLWFENVWADYRQKHIDTMDVVKENAL